MQTDLGSNIISDILVSSSRKLSVHHFVNRFTSEKYVLMSRLVNSRLRVAESSANLTVKFPEVVDVVVCVECVK